MSYKSFADPRDHFSDYCVSRVEARRQLGNSMLTSGQRNVASRKVLVTPTSRPAFA